MNKKFYLLGLCVAASATVANAQQLPNVGFDNWKDACGTTTWTSTMYNKGADFTRPGAEPADWNGSSVSSFGVTFEVCAKSENGNYVQLKNKSIVGNNIPAYLTLSNPWVFIGGSNILDAYGYAAYGDGGSYGGVAFTNRPDAIKLRYQKTQNTEVSHVVAYLWSGEFKSNVPSSATKNGVYTYGRELIDVDRVVLGRQTENVTATGKLIAKMDKELSELTADWTDLEIPFEYLDEKSVPEKMNVIISAADYWTRSNLQANTTLEVDDVDFVYYSTLTALEVNGKDVLEDGKYEYAMSGTELPTAEQIKATTKSQFAEAAVTVDSENAQVRIVVTNQGGKDTDGETSHTYTLQYEQPAAGVEYEGYLNVSCDDLGGVLVEDKKDRIIITETGEGLCSFALLNLTLNIGGRDIHLGDIVVDNVEVTEAEGVKSYNGAGDLTLVVGQVHVDLNGEIDANNSCDFTINVTWNSLPIVVKFTSEKKTSGVEGISGESVAVFGMAGAVAVSGYNGAVDVYSVDGRLVESVSVDGNAEIALNGGLYIVRVGGKAYKVLVK